MTDQNENTKPNETPEFDLKLRLTTDVTYRTNGDPPDDLKKRLFDVINHASDEGILTNDGGNAEVDGWDVRVDVLDADSEPKEPAYNDLLDPGDQVDMEEWISSLVFEKSSESAGGGDWLDESDCNKLGRQILRKVLQRFRPDLVGAEPQSKPAAEKFCSICYEPQQSSPSGDYCSNGHGGAPSLTREELEAATSGKPEFDVRWTAHFVTRVRATDENEAQMIVEDMDPEEKINAKYCTDSFDIFGVELAGNG